MSKDTDVVLFGIKMLAAILTHPIQREHLLGCDNHQQYRYLESFWLELCPLIER
jgi:hypothetical protein